jgi:MFS family permease
MVGSISGGSLCSHFGRKIPLAIVGVIGGVGSSMGAFLPSQYWELILVCRFLVGFSVGLGSSVCPLYVNELAPEARRGALSAVFQICITFGMVIANSITFIMHEHSTLAASSNSAILMHLGTIINVVALVLSLTMPESSVWLAPGASLKSGSPEINDGGSKYGAETDSLLQFGVSDLRGGWAGLFSRRHVKVLLTGIVMAVMLALTGINAVFLYATTLFEKNFKDKKELMSLLLYIFNFVCTIVAAAIVDRFPKKRLLLVGLAIMTVALCLLGVQVQWIAGEAGKWIGFVCLFTYVFGFAFGPGIVFWILVVQVFPESVRSQGSSLINLMQWSENLLLTLVFPLVLKEIDIQFTYWAFAAVSVFSAVCLGILLPGQKKFASLDSLDD